MSDHLNRRRLLQGIAAAGLTAAARPARGAAPAVHVPGAARPVVISDRSGIAYRNGGPRAAVEEAFARITAGEDVLDALVAGVAIPENDPQETGIGYGGLPNERGVVQLDASCMHGPLKRAGGVAALEGVRHPAQVARAVMQETDHHLLVGEGAREFARMMGFDTDEDLTTERSRRLWLEWKRRVDPDHWPEPGSRRAGEPQGTREAEASAGDRGPGAGIGTGDPEAWRQRWRRGYRAGLEMVREGLLDPHSFHGTIHCSGVNAGGEVCGVTSTSGLAWKIPGRAGDSPILGAGLYVDGDVGACGSTGRGEANLFNLSSFLIVEEMRRGAHPKDAGMEALRRIRASTVEPRLLNDRGEPAFDVRFFVLGRSGEHAGVALYGAAESVYAVCTEDGAEERPLEGLLDGSP